MDSFLNINTKFQKIISMTAAINNLCSIIVFTIVLNIFIIETMYPGLFLISLISSSLSLYLIGRELKERKVFGQRSFRSLGRMRMADFEDISICAEKKQHRKIDAVLTKVIQLEGKLIVLDRTLGKACDKRMPNHENG